MYGRPTPSQKKDIIDKSVDPWVYQTVYDNDAVNPLAHDRSHTKAPSKDSYSPYGNAPYWPENKEKKGPIPGELDPNYKEAKGE